MSTTDDGAPEARFEDALASLDEVVARLEGGQVGLEEAIALFERGQEHLAMCRRRLDVATRRIEELTSEDGAGQGSGVGA